MIETSNTLISREIFAGRKCVVISSTKNVSIIKKLSKKLKPARVHKLLEPLSFEAIIFFYALNPDRLLRKNIQDFLRRYSNVYLDIRGRDLKDMGLGPVTIYAKVLKNILYKKINGKIRGRKQEIDEARRALG